MTRLRRTTVLIVSATAVIREACPWVCLSLFLYFAQDESVDIRAAMRDLFHHSTRLLLWNRGRVL